MSASYSHDQIEALQVVVDRVSSYQDGAPTGTVERELREGFTETGVEIADDDVRRLAAAIEEKHGSIDAGTVLG